MSDLETKLRRVQGAAKAALIERMRDREAQIITRLVAAYRSGKADANMLYGGIATIAELRSIIIEAEHDKIAVDREVSNLTKEQ